MQQRKVVKGSGLGLIQDSLMFHNLLEGLKKELRPQSGYPTSGCNYTPIINVNILYGCIS
jgi:hypothetical protein